MTFNFYIEKIDEMISVSVFVNKNKKIDNYDTDDLAELWDKCKKYSNQKENN